MKERIVGEMCGDNRFELIEKYKQKLIKATNIETAKDEMEVIDAILFRFWQMGWLDKLEKTEKEEQRQRELFRVTHCVECKKYNVCGLRKRDLNVALNDGIGSCALFKKESK